MSLQPVKARRQAHDDLDEQANRFAGPWFDAKTAAAFIPCKNVRAWYAWRRSHGIVARNNGSVAKADLVRVLSRRKPRRVMHPNSLANLSHPAQPRASRPTRKFNSVESESI